MGQHRRYLRFAPGSSVHHLAERRHAARGVIRLLHDPPDALYLRDYARALAAVASRAPTASAVRMFAGHGRTRSPLNGNYPGLLSVNWEFPGKRRRAASLRGQPGLYELPAGHGARRKAPGPGRPAIGSTPRPAGNCCAAALPIPGTGDGPRPTAATSSARSRRPHRRAGSGFPRPFRR
jgi:hypothetical protein